ncbi:helix-turn-helix domain-containing protein [Paenibacillus sp. NPDC055715]
MNHTTTIRTELLNFMKHNDLNINQLSKVTGLNAGSISTMVNGNRALSVEQLDRITTAMGYAKGYFYERYIEEYLAKVALNWRRIKPFLYRCAELDKQGCIRQVIGLLLDKLMYSSYLFDLAEEFFKDGKYAIAAILYEGVALSEKSQHSERLALCQYRLFMAKQGDNQELNYQAAIEFQPFIDRLDEIDQLEALKDLANTYRSLRRWDKVEIVAQKLEHKSKIQYFSKCKPIRKKRNKQEKPSKPLYVYVAYSYLLRGSVCEEWGEYEQALQHIHAYTDLSWVKETDEESERWKGLFKEWAQVNTYVTKLFSGDVSVLPDYVAYIEVNKEETLLSLLNIIEAANRFDLNVDDILCKFNKEIKYITEMEKGVYTQQTTSERSSRLLNELAEYYLLKEMYQKGFEFLISGLERSSIMNNKSCIIKCVGLFERFRKDAYFETTETYQNLINEVYKNEKKIRATSFSG